ncbi:MAG TPA: PfkB family carbohydrate kinase [Candidatus Nanoarchaeia archaeon]|nr:PfkB family carbohydrate kinase [Candidatus Nanoarchaeia archaeon]
MAIPDFSNKKILVIGDLMLDKHIYGKVERISPEAPVPVLKAEKETYNPGGAATVAANLAALGCRTFIAGALGNDYAGGTLVNEMQKLNINTESILITQKPTIQKIRGLSKQHLFRIDYEDTSLLTQDDELTLLQMIKEILPEMDAIILSDYSKGTLTPGLIKAIIQEANNCKKLITADCKPINMQYYKDATIIKPNKKEALEAALASSIEEAGKILQGRLNAIMVITMGEEGISVFESNSQFHIPTKAQKIYDVAGAGDTVLAVLTLALTSNYSLKEAVELANEAAAIVISKPGVAFVSKEELFQETNIPTIKKTWGEEHIIANNEKYCGKKMLIKQGFYSSYHMHKIKEETFYIASGCLEVIHNGKYLQVKTGETLHLKPGEYHSFRALQDTTFFEFSTQHKDEDNYRLTKSSFGDSESWKQEIEAANRGVAEG